MIGLRDDSDFGPPPPSPEEAEHFASFATPPLPNHAQAFTAQLFAEGGWLQETLSLEHRPEQEQMARAAAAAFEGDEPLLFEAGTGVGKSLAYLLPGIIHAVDQSRQLIVSTHTIALQEQLQKKDLPLCRRLFEAVPELAPYAEFKASVLLGKANYLCTTRLARALADRASLFADSEYEELQRIAEWAKTSTDGLRHELQPPPRPEVWEAVNAASATCSRKNCDPTRCFYQSAKARLRSSQVIIVNHALLFALLNAGAGRAHASTTDSTARGVLYADDFLVLDEAHTVPEVATENFGLALSSYGVNRALSTLYSPKTQRGLLLKLAGAEAKQLVLDALEAARLFFESVHQQFLTARAVVRVREPETVSPLLDGPLGALHRLTLKTADKLDEGHDREELLEQANRIRAIQKSLSEWLTLGDSGHVYWAERSGRRQTIVTLRSAPIDVAAELRKQIFSGGTSVLCTSATLAIGGKMERFAARVGVEADAPSVVVESPFDYARCMHVYVASDVPLPSPQEARLAIEVLSDYVRFCTERVSGGSLVLFTSYHDMRAVAAALEPIYAAAGRPFLMQGQDMSRSELAEQMRAAGDAVLFGTDSFWTGIDVPGAALSQVILTRLPFDPPTHPIIEAKCEHIRERGGTPFVELTLPDALVKFRQGVGRLIRSASDHGIITILDSRVLAKSYGKLFLNSLPTRTHTRMTRATRDSIFPIGS
ncbi:helicase [Cephaloticoccus primus]|uniref:Helicase n=1 Tax=Cephaloticoccus primus TaxID=1548207 RepID=A0A139SLZ5_9BACT|nr:helicase C-terminal domain-containing protein [Cephaloticoccus primus]KXU35576.1 helicase [Cephaloticoccus primus]